jgi:putative flavoprotein involved in K+ transport
MARASSPRLIDTVVIGAGQAGLMMSYHLGRAAREHLVLERRRTLGGGWQDRWDNFRLVSPNWSSSLPGFPYDGPDPDGFMPRDQIAARIAEYGSVVDVPVMLGTAVTRLTHDSVRDRFLLETTEGPMAAREVVVASGAYGKPQTPAVGAALTSRITQLHSSDYRNEASLPPGAVLIVGSGQTGVQLAEELLDSGRRVFLSVGTAPRMRRRYRGRDCFRWLVLLKTDGARYGIPFPTAATLADPRLRLAALPQLTGHKGGSHEVDLRRMAKEDGLTLLGRLQAIDGHTASFGDDLEANLLRAEGSFDARFRPLIDRYVIAADLDVPEAEPLVVADFRPPAIPELDLAAAGITTVLWASGFRPTLDWIELPVFDEWGLPRLTAGQSDQAGLYFLGMPWQSSMISVSIPGTFLDAAEVAASMGIAESEPLGEMV